MAKQRLGIVMDPIAGIAAAKDSSLAMLIEAQRRGREAGDFRPTIPDHLRAPEDRQANASRIDPASLRATPQLDVPERNIERSR